jgi:hypothetical protein
LTVRTEAKALDGSLVVREMYDIEVAEPDQAQVRIPEGYSINDQAGKKWDKEGGDANSEIEWATFDSSATSSRTEDSCAARPNIVYAEAVIDNSLFHSALEKGGESEYAWVAFAEPKWNGSFVIEWVGGR